MSTVVTCGVVGGVIDNKYYLASAANDKSVGYFKFDSGMPAVYKILCCILTINRLQRL